MRIHAQQPRPGLESATLRRSPDVLRRCGCGGGGSAQGGCEACRKKTLQRQPAAGGARLMRQEAAKEPSNEETMKEAAKKTGEAFLETEVGRDIKKKTEDLGKEGPASAPPVVDDVLAGSGVPLPANVRGDLEARFGHDFGRVRVHTDARAADSALAVNARAYTVGERIVFGPGQFSPASSAGLRLLAHELAHVIQNETMHDTGRRASGAVIGAVDDPLEREAEAVSARVANAGDTHPTITPGER